MMIFTWNNNNTSFVETCLEAGGSGNISAELENGLRRPNGNEELGRYARNYCQEDGDVPGRLVRFIIELRKPLEDTYVRITMVPFSTAQEQDAAYQLLASAGCSCNDMTAEESMMAKDSRRW